MAACCLGAAFCSGKGNSRSQRVSTGLLFMTNREEYRFRVGRQELLTLGVKKSLQSRQNPPAL
jgi:hypothetical protein